MAVELNKGDWLSLNEDLVLVQLKDFSDDSKLWRPDTIHLSAEEGIVSEIGPLKKYKLPAGCKIGSRVHITKYGGTHINIKRYDPSNPEELKALKADHRDEYDRYIMISANDLNAVVYKADERLSDEEIGELLDPIEETLTVQSIQERQAEIDELIQEMRAQIDALKKQEPTKPETETAKDAA